MFLDNTSCNLASINLMKFLDERGEFDVEAYREACRILITAQEILVDNASYPTEAITQNSRDFRPLGLGYANLGALLMASGLPYDSDAGRDVAAALTAVMTGEAYAQSARIAQKKGPFHGFAINREPMLRVMDQHRRSVDHINPAHVPLPLLSAARDAWDKACQLGDLYGYRNSQATVIAPTGTIGFMMDCDTTGIEPDIALVKYKKLVGGGMLKIVNQTVPIALRRIGYPDAQVSEILQYIDENDTIEGAPHLRPDDLAVFDCAFKPAKGTRSIHYMGHVKMMAAAQPFISGAISKTVNLPENANVEDIMEAYIQSWKMGLKAVAIYRDGSKKAQPLMAAQNKEEAAKRGTRGEKAVPATTEETAFTKLTPEQQAMALAAVRMPTTEEQESAPPRAIRHRLPSERLSVTHKFDIASHEGYITVGLYKDGKPGEIFIRMAKEGSTVSGLMDSFATAVSLALQHGVPLKLLCDKFSHTRFEPSGWSGNPEIGFSKSIMDYIFRCLQMRFLDGAQQTLFAVPAPQSSSEPVEAGNPAQALGRVVELGDAPVCIQCGSLMVPNGSHCFRCMLCGHTNGCS